MTAAPNGPGADGRAKTGAPELCAIPEEHDPWDAGAAPLDVAAAFSPEAVDGDGPGKPVWGALTDGADTLASEGGPAACEDFDAAAALIKL